ncbi:MAG: hypothetical protein IPO66_09975 [Rhodanobacteraceae bacterium]|nr:hypothetical protein [Rhodanobacteraceae bacterium]
MKLQIDSQRLRFRVDEAELARLLAGESVVDQTQLSESQILRRRICVRPFATAQLAWGRRRFASTCRKTPCAATPTACRAVMR